ncbi:MAG: hypothetical protein RR575_08210 [Acinetobacter sp.]
MFYINSKVQFAILLIYPKGVLSKRNKKSPARSAGLGKLKLKVDLF